MPQDFSGQNLQGRSFQGQNLAGANFSHAHIQGANFTNATLTNANFSYAQAGLTPRAAFCLVIICLFAAMVAGTTSGYSGSMELAAMQAGKLTAICASLVVLMTLPIFSYIAIRYDFFRAVLISILAPVFGVLPLIWVWAGLLKGTVISALNGIVPGTVLVSFIFSAVATFAIAIAAAKLVSPAAALAVAATGVLFVAGSVAGSIGTLGTVIVSGQPFSTEELTDRISKGTFSVIHLNVAVEAVAGSLLFAGATILMGATVVAGLGIYLGWRVLLEDEKQALLRHMVIQLATKGGTNFQSANLTDANFTQAILNSTNFRKTTLTRTCFFCAQKLFFSDLRTTYLENYQVRQLLVTRQGKNQKFDGQNMAELNLQCTNLVEASLINTDLSKANLQQANLSRAILVRSQLEHADLTGAILTGACIENWLISRNTKLEGVECDYIYMQQENSENFNPNRIPHQAEFKKGEFIDFVHSILDTLDLYHDENIDSRAVVTVLNSLSEDYHEILEIVGLEKRGNGIIIKVKTTREAKQNEIKQEYYSRYEQILKKPLGQNQVSPAYDFIEAKVGELASLVEEIKRHPTTTIKYLYSEGIVITGGEVDVRLDQTISQPVNSESNNVDYFSLENISDAAFKAINQVLLYNRELSANFRTVLMKLHRAIATDPNLQSEDKCEALEQVQVLAQAWQDTQTGTIPQQGRIAIKILKGMTAEFPNATKFCEACDRLLPAIATLLKK